MRQRIPIFALLGLLLLAGCVRAERVRYQRHLATIIEPTPSTGNRAVALGVREEPRDEDEPERE